MSCQRLKNPSPLNICRSTQRGRLLATFEASCDAMVHPAAYVVYAWGSNRDGQLGLQDAVQTNSEGGDDVRAPRLQSQPFESVPAALPAFRGLPVKMLSCGSRHSLALTLAGEVFSWGWGKCGQLGHGDLASSGAPRAVAALEKEKCSMISAGGIHSAALSNKGTMFTWGEASYGQLGQGVEAVRKRIVAVPGALVWSRARRENSVGELETAAVAVPEDVPELAHISCGGQHSGAVSKDGRVFTWGRADSGQLGLAQSWIDNLEDQPQIMFSSGEDLKKGSMKMGKMRGLEVPIEVTLLPSSSEDPAISIACGAFHTISVLRSGRCFAWGNEEYGMLGLGRSRGWKAGVSAPREVTASGLGCQGGPYVEGLGREVERVSAGGWHTAFLTRHGSVLMAGRGEYGRLGLHDEKDTRLPHVLHVPFNRRIQPQDSAGMSEKLDGGVVGRLDLPPRVEEVSLGGTHSLVLASGGHVYACGRGDYGRLGKGDLEPTNKLCLVASLSPDVLGGGVVVQVAAGGQHNLALVVNPDMLEREGGDTLAIQRARTVLSSRFNEDGFKELTNTIPRSPRPTSPLPQGRRQLTSLSSLGSASQGRQAYGNELRLTGRAGSDNDDVLTIDRIAVEELDSRISNSPLGTPHGVSFSPADLQELLYEQERSARPRMLQRRRL